MCWLSLCHGVFAQEEFSESFAALSELEDTYGSARASARSYQAHPKRDFQVPNGRRSSLCFQLSQPFRGHLYTFLETNAPR